ncbi:MAG: DUF1015 domain-containing protein, partial [Actinomycetia bacterium]|nr:DUF1015 domain-containing protein [Actinomycetes bacterium]
MTTGLSLTPFRALRPTAPPQRLGGLLCPPYDVIDEEQRSQLLAGDADNAVRVILPRDGADPYGTAARRLDDMVAAGALAVDERPALYVYEMRPADGGVTRGLLGAAQLRDPADGVILPHENTMAGPVADRLALMRATEANLEPIYLVYDGGGAASAAVRSVSDDPPLAAATTADGTAHRLWALTDPAAHAAIAADLASHSALIADGHHRYATYRELQRELAAERGAGPWDRGLALLVDATSYGPQVHPIHRTVAGLTFTEAITLADGTFRVDRTADLADALATLADPANGPNHPRPANRPGLPNQPGLRFQPSLVHEPTRADRPGFAAVVTDGTAAAVLSDPDPAAVAATGHPGDPDALADLDVTVLHRLLVGRVWGLQDTVEVVGYAHAVDEAVAAARATHGIAVLLRPTPVS